MNILIPDSWLREYLKTKATPEQIKECLSLCGPSIERIHKVGGEIVYDVEVTTNRPDSMSIFGVAREAVAILPRFSIKAKLINDPYVHKGSTLHALNTFKFSKRVDPSRIKQLDISTDPKLNPRWTSVVISNVTVGPSPKWLQKKLELTGIRPLNNIVDITNYLMRSYGQPAHAFDYEEIKPGKNGIPTMMLRASKKSEKLTTLDGKTHTLSGGDIVIEDGSGRLIDLCGIMGAENSSIKSTTKTIILFMQTYDPVRIRKTQMALSQRTEAGSLFEKGLDSELVLPTIMKGIELTKELAGGKVASKIYDFYPKPYKSYIVSVKRKKVDAYLGIKLSDKEIKKILVSLGFVVETSEEKIIVNVPSFRRDIEIDVDIIEELARMYGYHNLKSTLPDTAPPITQIDPLLTWEEEIKIRLRDWGFTETYTYSMISEELMDVFELDKKQAYKIANPLSSEWVYMRPTLTPSLLLTLKQNLHLQNELKLFELSMIYRYREGNLPVEEPCLLVVWEGDRFLEAKGLAQALFALLGIDFPADDTDQSSSHLTWYSKKALKLGEYGALGVMDPLFLAKLKIKVSVTRLYLDIFKLLKNAKIYKQYHPIPRYTPLIEDFSFILPQKTAVGQVLQKIKTVSPMIDSIRLLNQYEDTSTFRVHYLDRNKQLTENEVTEVRQKIISTIGSTFSAKIKA